ncbi:Chromo domain - like 2 [Theobroma cacao]|nr:Chromo domain - like 2 [Theobroma cacao]
MDYRVLRACQLLSEIYGRIFKKDSSIDRITEKGIEVELDAVVPRSLRRLERRDDDRSCFIIPRYYKALQGKLKDWPNLLDMAQLCFNSQKSSTTNRTPFEVVTGQQLRLSHTSMESYSRKSPRVFNFVKEWRQNIEIVRAYLEKPFSRMKKWVDKGTPRVSLQQLEAIYANPANASKSRATKATISTKPLSQGRVEEILARMTMIINRRSTQEYLVRWEGLGPDKITWEKKVNLRTFQQKIEEFQANQSTWTSID